MKYALSTLGCPRWDYDDIVVTAKDLGYNGIEIRGVADELYAPKIKAFNEDNILKSIDKLGKLEIPMLTTNSTVATDTDIDKSMREGMEYIELAGRLGTKYIRILCTNKAGLDDGDYNLALRKYDELCEYGKEYNVTPLIETNGMFCNTSLLNKFINELNNNNSGVLWDIHHPYRFNNEAISYTLENIGDFIRYVHIKDSIIVDGDVKYRMLGHGDIPVGEALNGLKKIGYDGYITLEWVKRWNPDLEEPGIVFAHFINKIKEYTK